MNNNYNNLLGKNIKIVLEDGDIFTGKLEYIMKPEDDEEEEMLFIGKSLALETRLIREISILD